MKVLGDLLACCAVSKIFIALSSMREERDVEVAVVRDEGPCGAPSEGVLVEWRLDRTFDSWDTQCRIEFSQCGREPAQIRSLS